MKNLLRQKWEQLTSRKENRIRKSEPRQNTESTIGETRTTSSKTQGEGPSAATVVDAVTAFVSRFVFLRKTRLFISSWPRGSSQLTCNKILTSWDISLPIRRNRRVERLLY